MSGPIKSAGNNARRVHRADLIPADDAAPSHASAPSAEIQLVAAEEEVAAAEAAKAEEPVPPSTGEAQWNWSPTDLNGDGRADRGTALVRGDARVVAPGGMSPSFAMLTSIVSASTPPGVLSATRL